MFTVSDEEFDSIVDDAIETIPDRFLDEVENLLFMVEEDCPEQEDGSALLGLYEGYSILERDDYYGAGEMPDTITIYKRPHEEMCNSLEELREAVRMTVVHELGHYFGMDEDQLEEMGYGSCDW